MCPLRLPRSPPSLLPARARRVRDNGVSAAAAAECTAACSPGAAGGCRAHAAFTRVQAPAAARQHVSAQHGALQLAARCCAASVWTSIAMCMCCRRTRSRRQHHAWRHDAWSTAAEWRMAHRPRRRPQSACRAAWRPSCAKGRSCRRCCCCRWVLLCRRQEREGAVLHRMPCASQSAAAGAAAAPVLCMLVRLPSAGRRCCALPARPDGSWMDPYEALS